MSELKVYHCNEWHNEYTEFYIKAEADKVIANLEESHKMEVEQLLMEIAELKILYSKWSNRCLKIAEKFKTNSTINRKEATNAL